MRIHVLPRSAARSARIISAALLINAALVALLAGCAGNGAGLDANGRPIGAGGGGGAPLTADLASIQANVFTPICSVCHAGGGAPQGLRLDAANAYTLLVGVPSTEVPAILRVKPGDPNNSYIIQKLQGHAAVGAQMPLGGPPLPASTIAVISQWITDGAPNSRAVAVALSLVAVASSLKVSAVIPASGDILSESPPQIAVGFNRELDLTRVDSGSMRLERIAGVEPSPSMEPDSNAQASISAERFMSVAARLLSPVENPRALMLIPAKPLASGRYRLVLRGDAGLELADTQGVILGDGMRTANGDWLVTTFDLQTPP